MASLQDIVQFRYGSAKPLIEVEGFIYFCDSKLNELLRGYEGLEKNAAVFYASLMFNKGIRDTQRNIHFRYDQRTTIFYMEPIDTKPNEDGAYQYKCLFFGEANFLYIDGGYPDLENWRDTSVIPKATIETFSEWMNYRDDARFNFISTHDHTPNFYH